MQNQKGNINVIVSFIIVIGIIGLAIYSLMNKPTENNPSKSITTNDGTVTVIVANPDDNQEQPSKKNKDMDLNKKLLKDFTPVLKINKLEKIDIIVGTGKEVVTSDTVSVHYIGAVASTGTIFQSSKDFGPEAVTFPLANVIKGWTEGIPGMKIGGTRRLMIPSDMAYGATPPPGSGIPANADLVFDVELVKIN